MHKHKLHVKIKILVCKTSFVYCIILLTATNESLNTEMREIMNNMDKLRNSLYEDFRPQIKMLEELQIDDGNIKNIPPLVATKKVAQMRVPSTTSSSQDNQLEILAIETPATKKIMVHNLPAACGPLVKPTPEPDSNVYITKNPVMPWIRAKVCIEYRIIFMRYK